MIAINNISPVYQFSLTESLRTAILCCDMSLSEISARSNVDRKSIRDFAYNGRSLRLDSAERLINLFREVRMEYQDEEPDSLTNQLREWIDASGLTRRRIAAGAGISESTLAQFYNRRRGLSIEALNALVDFLQLELQPKNKNRGRPFGTNFKRGVR